MKRDISEQIDQLARRRQYLLANESGSDEIARIGKELDALYEDLRIERARDASGLTRSEIVRRARLDVEIERLMSS